MKNKSVLVIEGASKVGSIICDLLVKNGYSVCCLDDFRKNLDGLRDVISHDEFIFLNTKDPVDGALRLDFEKYGLDISGVLYAIDMKKETVAKRAKTLNRIKKI